MLINVYSHSLGAHAAGYAGSFVEKGKVHRITGLGTTKGFFLFVLAKRNVFRRHCLA